MVVGVAVSVAATAVIRGRPRPSCPICGTPGTVRFAGLPDLWHRVPGRWDVRACGPCETLWMDPEPVADDIHMLYPDSYPTHDAPFDVLEGGPGRIGRLRRELKLQVLATAFGYDAVARTGGLRAVGAALARVGGVRRQVGLNNARLIPGPPGRLLDVGCGNGGYLLTMRRLGWTVEGIEPDARAAARARANGFNVTSAALADVPLEPGAYHAITLHHVLEHLPDPAAAIARLAAALRPGGRLVSVSPNPCCGAARHFGRWWRGLEIPRHLVLPGRRGLLRMAAGAGLAPRIGYSARMTRWLIRDSFAARDGRRRDRRAEILAVLLRITTPRSGPDEIILDARRP